MSLCLNPPPARYFQEFVAGSVARRRSSAQDLQVSIYSDVRVHVFRGCITNSD